MAIAAGFRQYYGLFGFHGLLAITGRRLLGRPREIVGQPNGVRHPVHLRVRTTDISLYHDLLISGAYDFQLPNDPRTIIDAGANVGLATIFFANKYPGAKIVAVEPEPSNYALLCRNIQPYANVVPIQAALWCADCEVHLGLPKHVSANVGKWAFQVQETGVSVRGMTLSTLMREANLDEVDLLKMDIEGGEIEAFASSAWVGKVRTMAIELHDRIRPGCRAAVEKATQGFRVAQQGEMTFYSRTELAVA